LKNMLMKFAKVLESGEFIKPKSQVLTYGTMTLVRVTIVRDQSLFLSKAATIAMRYATVRRQSPIDPNQPEPKIIEHVTQQMKIFPAIAKVIVIKAAAENLLKLYLEICQDCQKCTRFHVASNQFQLTKSLKAFKFADSHAAVMAT
jgi:acyl-CoA oxidase